MHVNVNTAITPKPETQMVLCKAVQERNEFTGIRELQWELLQQLNCAL